MFLGAEVTLIYHGTEARLSLRAIAPSPSKKNSGLTNPRWWMHIDFLEKDSVYSGWELRAISLIKLDKLASEMRVKKQRLAGLE